MKKFLLFAFVAVVALNASAANRVQKSSLPIVKKTFMTPEKSQGIVVKQTMVSDFLKSQKRNAIIAKTTRADEEAPELIPSYSVSSYKMCIGDFWNYFMYDGASFLVTEDGKAYLQADTFMDALEGKVETGVTNEYSEDGADSITFVVSRVASYKDTLGVSKGLNLEPVDYTLNEEQTAYVFNRANAETFGAYYFAEYNELYVPYVLALYDEDKTVDEFFDETYTYTDLDLEPQENYNDYISKATISAVSKYSTEEANYDFETEAKVMLGNQYFIVSNTLDGREVPAWMRITYDTETEGYIVKPYQYLDEGHWYTDETRTATTKGVICTYGTTPFTVTDNADETTTLATDGDETYLVQVNFRDNGDAYYWDQYKMSINILYEPVADGIQSVGAESSAKFQNAIYNMAGQRVGKNFKGLVIKNGKKVVVK